MKISSMMNFAHLQTAILSVFLLLTTALAHGQNHEQAPPSPAVSTPLVQQVPSNPADSTQLVVIKSPKPDYPPQAAAKSLQGQVWIKLLISETGDVEETEIVSGDPVLANATVIAMKKWKFKPYIRNGKAVKVSTKMPYDFAFRSNVSEVPQPAQDTLAMPAPAAPSSGPDVQAAPQRLRVSQGVMEGSVIHRVEPVYPPAARRSYIQGTVLLQAIIGKDGRIRDIRVVSGPSELVEASVGAVQQWRYRPYLLMGKPVEVETTIKIQFHM